MVLYDGANEVVVQRNGSSSVLAYVVMTTVAQEDDSRIVWPSSPAAGWLTGVSRLYGTPNGQPLVPLVGANPHIWDSGNERHGPYTAGVGDGFPTVDRDPWSQAPTYSPQMPLTVRPGNTTGVQYPSVFVSEFGCMTMASFESMAPTLSPAHWAIHGGAPPDNCTQDMAATCTGDNVMAQRNWACDNVIWTMFGSARLNATAGEASFKAQLFQCLVGQALTMQQDIETRHASNELGHLLWQLNDIWPTGGWGSLEYGTVGFTPGQVRGGRWKPLHYWLAAHLFADVRATCGGVYRSTEHVCYVRNDRAGLPFSGVVTLTTYELLGDGTPVTWATQPAVLGAGPGAVLWFGTPGNTLPNGNTTVLVATVTEAGGAIVSSHMVQLTAPRNLLAPRATLSLSIAPAANADGSVNVTVTADRVALFVTLTTQAQGRFTDNCFLLPATSRTVRFVPFSDGTHAVDVATLRETLRVEDHSTYAS